MDEEYPMYPEPGYEREGCSIQVCPLCGEVDYLPDGWEGCRRVQAARAAGILPPITQKEEMNGRDRLA